MNRSRRSFFRDLFCETARGVVGGFESERREQEKREEFDRFFDSYESSYALTLCYPDDILLETARKEGIKCEGREKLDIVKDLILKKGWFHDRSSSSHSD
jgi:hypothetical protein